MPTSRQTTKSAGAFRTISEVSDDLEVPQHVLRFWETKFAQVRPLKRGGGRRYYRPDDIQLLRRIRNLLYTDGYTIRGVQRLLREGRSAATAGRGAAGAGGPGAVTVPDASRPAGQRAEFDALLQELEELRDLLRGKAK